MAIKNIPHTIRVLESFSDGQCFFRVADHLYDCGEQENTRNLEFRKPESSLYYLHSSVYIDSHAVRQPIYDIPQDILTYLGNNISIKNALVLGCAGCTIPRFLALKHSNCKITGIEISSQLISIAKKYFFIDEFDSRFVLLQSDAFEYLKHHRVKNQFDIVYVDLFNGNSVPAEIFTESFVRNLILQMSKNAISIINLLDVDESDICNFQEMIKGMGMSSLYISDGSRGFLTLCNDCVSNLWQLEKHLTQKYVLRLV